MQEAIILLVSLTLIDVWIYELVIPICLRDFKNSWKCNFKTIFDRKPFNCDICLSFWIGLILSILCMNIVFLLLPLLTKIKNRLI